MTNTTPPSPAGPRVALVTGANQGLGLALVRGLAAQLQPADVVYLTGRDRERVEAAAQAIEGARAEVRPRVLDVRDTAAVDALAEELRATHGGIDIVFSNHYARFLPGDDPATEIAGYVDTNNLGTTRVLRAFAPILRPGGRLIVVSSTLGSLHYLAPALHDRFDTDTMTLDDVDSAMLAWRDRVVDGRLSEGWPAFINIPSKIGQVAAVRVLARERRAADLADGTLIVATCPAMIDTATSRPWFDMSDAQTPDEAAVAPLRLALDAQIDSALHGELVRFGQVLPWHPPGALR
jgi:NAD(P)-dependent dehydrogenase (short-subunit alcohol dehydrogenase family)